MSHSIPSRRGARSIAAKFGALRPSRDLRRMEYTFLPSGSLYNGAAPSGQRQARRTPAHQMG
jgi:hypothetical protein